jgi:hypothetical protein
MDEISLFGRLACSRDIIARRAATTRSVVASPLWSAPLAMTAAAHGGASHILYMLFLIAVSSIDVSSRGEARCSNPVNVTTVGGAGAAGGAATVTPASFRRR